MCINTHVYMYASEMEAFEVESCVCGHHVFCSIWSPRIGEQLTFKRDLGNAQDETNFELRKLILNFKFGSRAIFCQIAKI